MKKLKEQRFLDIEMDFGEMEKSEKECENCMAHVEKYVQSDGDAKIACKIGEICVLKQASMLCLMAGDGDLEPAIKNIDKYGVEFRLIGFNVGDCMSADLSRHDENVGWLDNF